MAFETSIEVHKVNSGVIRGIRKDVACMSWFPQGKDPFPISFKFKDDNDEIQTVRNIRIISIEDKAYDGIPSKEYQCMAIVGGLLHEFKMIFFLENCQWQLII